LPDVTPVRCFTEINPPNTCGANQPFFLANLFKKMANLRRRNVRKKNPNRRSNICADWDWDAAGKVKR
jgi:hypothetical protein